jgi:hypothetical protein
MTKVEEALYQTKNRSPQDPLNFPIRLNNKYGHVGALAGMGQNRPTEQMYAVKAELEALINVELESWAQLKTDLDKLSTNLKKSDSFKMFDY